ncbi:BrnT family toxin [Patescibacteria group bacterium]|nr:BrnT family toxin [Patescibacteria group bacterium]
MRGSLNLDGPIGFEWDKGNVGHIEKHSVDYKECEAVFFNKPLIVNKDITHSRTEERYRVYGQTDKGRLIFMIFTIRDSRIRVISARDQSKKERAEFQQIGGEQQ